MNKIIDRLWFCRKRNKEITLEHCIDCFNNNKSGFSSLDICRIYNLEEKKEE
jgi:hypothetical protein